MYLGSSNLNFKAVQYILSVQNLSGDLRTLLPISMGKIDSISERKG